VGIVIGVAVVLALVVFVLPRLRAAGAERRLRGRRQEVAGRHREEAEAQRLRAEAAEQHARRERAEAELHESRAAMHERGLADDQLDANGDMPPARDAPPRETGRRGERPVR
jgi:F0F1-type ATP synthase membrane subunit b/b'